MVKNQSDVRSVDAKFLLSLRPRRKRPKNSPKSDFSQFCAQLYVIPFFRGIYRLDAQKTISRHSRYPFLP